MDNDIRIRACAGGTSPQDTIPIVKIEDALLGHCDSCRCTYRPLDKDIREEGKQFATWMAGNVSSTFLDGFFAKYRKIIPARFGPQGPT